MASAQSQYGLNVAVVYQDDRTREQAMRVCARATHLVGPGSVRCTWWKTKVLNHPWVLLEAVRAAVLADVILVAVWATRRVPLELSRWAEGWLARRPRKEGALLALIGTPEQPTSELYPVLDYLRVVADMGHLDLLPCEFRLPIESSAQASEDTLDQAGYHAPLADQILSHEHASFWSHWGLNE